MMGERRWVESLLDEGTRFIHARSWPDVPATADVPRSSATSPRVPERRPPYTPTATRSLMCLMAEDNIVTNASPPATAERRDQSRHHVGQRKEALLASIGTVRCGSLMTCRAQNDRPRRHSRNPRTKLAHVDLCIFLADEPPTPCGDRERCLAAGPQRDRTISPTDRSPNALRRPRTCFGTSAVEQRPLTPTAGLTPCSTVRGEPGSWRRITDCFTELARPLGLFVTPLDPLDGGALAAGPRTCSQEAPPPEPSRSSTRSEPSEWETRASFTDAICVAHGHREAKNPDSVREIIRPLLAALEPT